MSFDTALEEAKTSYPEDNVAVLPGLLADFLPLRKFAEKKQDKRNLKILDTADSLLDYMTIAADTNNAETRAEYDLKAGQAIRKIFTALLQEEFKEHYFDE